MPIIVTNNGLEDSNAAHLGGFLISLLDFSVSDATGFDLKTDQEQLVGQTLYRGRITTVEAISRDSVRLTCTVPKAKPAVGQWNLTELGIWNSNGRLFAHGVFPAFPKSSEYGLKFYVMVTLGRLGEIINVTVSDTMSLPSAATVATLQPAAESSQNTMVVLDGNAHLEEINRGMPKSTSSPTIAVKYGGLGERWGFPGYSEVFDGKMDRLVDSSSFVLNANNQGFWLSDGEVVIVAFNDGPSAGESRKMQYSRTSQTFTSIDEPLPLMSTTSVFSIWRSHEAMLPRRRNGVPSYMVLGHGTDNYTQTTISTSPTRLQPYLTNITGNGGDTYTIGSGIPMAQVDGAQSLIVQPQDRNVLQPGQYTVQGNQLRIVGGLANGKTCAVWVFARSTDAPGGVNRILDAVYDTTGLAAYTLSTVPQSKNDVFVQTSDGKTYGPNDFTISGTEFKFVAGKIPAIGLKLSIQQAGIATSYQQRGAMTRTTYTAPAPTREITSTQPIPDKLNTLLMVNGVFIQKSRYSAAGTKITLMDSIAANSVVDLLVFWYEDTVSVGTRSGSDTGPQWIDPAGEQGTPNKLIPSRVRYVADGRPSYAVDPVLDENHLIVFVGETYLPPSGFVYDGNNIWPRESPVVGTPVEVICFKSMDHSGTIAKPVVTEVQTNGTRSVIVQKNANVASLIVMIDSVYRHSTSYTYNATTGQITFNNDVPANRLITAWSYADQDDAGKQVRMYSTEQMMSQGTMRYLLKGTMSAAQEVLAFTNGDLIGYGNWALLNLSGNYYINLSVFNPAWQGSQLASVEFSSRLPERRLVLRTELSGYLKADRNLADVPDKAQARENLGLSNIAPADGVLYKANNLSDVPNKALARENLGITPIITQLNNNMLLKANNLSDVPDKAAARNNLGITPLIADIVARMLDKNNNLADIPNKAAARANLGIPDNAAVDSKINWADGSSRFKLGDLIIISGKYRHWTVIGEQTLWIPFTDVFPGGCLTVIQSTWLPAPSMYWDGISQLCGNPAAHGFQIQVQTSDSKTRRWQGLDYIAIGW